MPIYVKQLFFVLVICATVFTFAKPLALKFMASEDFTRRRNVWYALTAAAFLSSSFWLFVIVAIPVMVIAGRRDSNPSALYLFLLQVIPPIDIPVPMVGMSYLINLNNHLLLSFCIMTPAALRIIRADDHPRLSGFRFMELCLLAYGAMTAVFYMHSQAPDGSAYPNSITESMRRGFLFLFDIAIPYFLISRANINRSMLVDCMASFCLSCALLSAIGAFESARDWLLYVELSGRWGSPIMLYKLYLTRGSTLRAMASSGHSMALGHMLVIGLGFWLYLQTRLDSLRTKIGGTLLFWTGQFAAYSRGAWIGGVLAYFLFAALGPRGLSKFFKATGIAIVVASIIAVTPLADRIARVLPFLGGTIDNFNITYRERLVDRSWDVIKQSPFLGDPAAMIKLADMRQGQGIVDILNSYIGVLLSDGVVGLALFLFFILIALFKSWSFSRKIMQLDLDYGLLGTSLVVCILTTLLLLENGSFLGITEKIFYFLAALAVAYVSVGQSMRHQPRSGQPVVRRRAPPR